MGGGAGVRWKFWMDSAEVVYHPYSKKDTGVLVPARQPELVEFEAYGYMDGMGNVRGDLFKVTNFEVVVPEDARQEVKEQFDYWHEGAGSQVPVVLTQHDTCETGPSYEFLIWGGYIRGKIENVVFDLEGDVQLERYYSSGVTWSCRLEPTEEFYYWWDDVFEEYPGVDEEDAWQFWHDIEINYRLPKEKWNGR